MLIVVEGVLHDAAAHRAEGAVVVDAVVVRGADGAAVQAEPADLFVVPGEAGDQGIVGVEHQLYNAEGSNQIEGVATLILCGSTLGGKVRGDVLLLESDERYAFIINHSLY